MNISPVDSEVVLPVEQFTAVSARKRLDLPVDRVGVSVESTLVLRLELTLVAVEGDTLMVLKYVILELLPGVELLGAILASEDLVEPLDMVLHLVPADVLIVAVLAVTQPLLGLDLCLEVVALLPVVEEDSLTPEDRTQSTPVHEGSLPVVSLGVPHHRPPAGVTEVTAGAGVPTAAVTGEKVVGQLLLVLGMGPALAADQPGGQAGRHVVTVLREGSSEAAGDAGHGDLVDDLELLLVLLLPGQVMLLDHVLDDLCLVEGTDVTVSAEEGRLLVVSDFFFFLFFTFQFPPTCT